MLDCPPPEDLGGCVAILGNVIVESMESALAPYGLLPGEYALLRVFLVEERGPGEGLTPTQLTHALPYEASRISRIVNRVVELGLLRRRRLREDRRVIRLDLTEEGERVTSEIVRRMNDIEERLLSGIDDSEVRSLILTICKIRVNFAAENPSGEPAQQPHSPPSLSAGLYLQE